MDTNGTRFHLFLSRDDWGRFKHEGVPLGELWRASPPAEAPVVWSDGELSLQPRLFRHVAAKADVAPEPKQRRSGAADRFGNLYWIGDGYDEVLVQSSGSGAVSRFWPPPAAPTEPARHGDFEPPPPPPREAPSLRALAVTEDHYLVVAVTDPKGLLVFDLFAGGPPTEMTWPAGVDFEPFDMAARPGGGVWILDKRNRYWGFDRHLRVLREEQAEQTLREAEEDAFQPVDPGAPRRGTERRVFPLGITYDAASPIEVEEAFGIEALPDGSVLILDRHASSGFSRILRYRFARRLGEPLSLDIVFGIVEEGENAGFRLVAHDFAVVPADPATGEGEELFVASSEGNQAYALRLLRSGDALALEPIAKFFPMRRFEGKGLLVAGRRAHYDFGAGWVPLACQGRPRYRTHAVIELGARPGTEVAVTALDGDEPDCTWHRLLLDASIPSETDIEIWSRAANEIALLEGSPWQREPDLYRRGEGAELPWLPPFKSPRALGASHIEYGTWELLFQRARGRFLQLRLVLQGNERATPRLHALRAWYPRFSYPENYLPAIYREDRASGDFLERFLANVEGFCTTFEDKIATVQTLFDAASAPPETLDWLARWFDTSLDPAWDERRRRLFIRNAVHFYQFRGTSHGLRMALGLVLDPEIGECELEGLSRISEARRRIRIVERYLTRRTPGVVFGAPDADTGPREVPLPPGARPDDTALRPAATPANAAEREAWQEFLERKYRGKTADLNAAHAASYATFAAIPLPRDLPKNESARRDWREFVQVAERPALLHERRLWQDVLARRYGQIATLNAAYRTSWTGFREIPLPDVLPSEGAALADWQRYETLVKPIQKHAHRFSIFIPTTGPGAELEALRDRLGLVRRVVDLAKPAHTVFDVGFYWALFRVGDARLGFDTLLDAGSRAAELLPPFTLGKGALGEAHLPRPPGHPGDERLSLD